MPGKKSEIFISANDNLGKLINSKTITYSTTTANFHNPIMRLYHIYIHQKVERANYHQQQTDESKKMRPSLQESKLNQLANLTRGKGQQDFVNA